MSNSLAIGAVTAAIQQLLGAIASPLPGDPDPDPVLTDAFVSTKPLDAARDISDEGRNQLNVFLFQLVADAALRNMDMPGRVLPGETGQQPLALNLYYVLTAYGANHDDIQAHRMLGRAMSILHDNSTLSRTTLQTALPGSDLYQQVERVRIRPFPLGTEEISKLWTGFSQPYRISVAYEVTVVLIESTKAKIAPIPVLTRGLPVGGVEPGPKVSPNLDLPYPGLDGFDAPKKRPAIRIGETLTIRGHNLGGTPLVVHFDHPLLANPLDPPIGGRDATHVDVPIPNQPTVWPAGMYAVTVDVTSDQLRTTNVLSVPLAPTITNITKISSSPTVLQVDFTPNVWPDQNVSLIVGNQQVRAAPHGQVGTLQFTILDPPIGLTYIRLRVDGVDSLLITDYTAAPPVFDSTQAVTLP